MKPSFLTRWFRALSSDNAEAASGILTRPRFKELLRVERARADRNQRSFSLVVFDAGAPGEDQAQSLIRVIRSRVRVTDEIGWFDQDRVGIFLPDTSPEGAEALAKDLSQHLGQPELSHRIYVHQSFPQTPPHAGTDSRRANNSRRGTDSPEENDPNRDSDQNGPDQNGPDQNGPHEIGSDSDPETTARLAPPTVDLAPHLAYADAWSKRALDILGASSLLLLLSPVLAATALAVRVTSRGPIIFSQIRVGRGGRLFRIHKFRSMVIDAEARKKELLAANEQSGPVFKMKRDPRFTRIGAFIRRTSLDELPQLWNVLKGDMSLVGPRPPTPDEVPKYHGWHRARLDRTGGLTCFWQVNGRSQIGFEDWMRLDNAYIRKQSFLLDLILLLRTPAAVLSGRGAH